MKRFYNTFKESSKQTKYFILTWIFYGLIIIISTVFSYARIDYVRNIPPSKEAIEEAAKQGMDLQSKEEQQTPDNTKPLSSK
ncbi:hypothetical protein BN1013_01182 [Candidatus Rubidus massiliensis]|mgnify:CR=1 FL=1|nr:MAG: hypothetical protein BGO10_10655 [Chlamydia sp. 32-24]CDZ80664.1 hypothetical protein BN1013_01182 [Candidatus Rubidus massiliensis]